MFKIVHQMKAHGKLKKRSHDLFRPVAIDARLVQTEYVSALQSCARPGAGCGP